MSSQKPAPDKNFLSRGWHSLSRHPQWRFITEVRIIAALLLVASCLFAFVEIADEVMDNETRQVDSVVLRWFRSPADMSQPVGPEWLKVAALDTTALGGTTVLIFVVLITLGFLWIAKKRKAFLLVGAAAVGGQLFNSGLKIFFSRPRPDIVPHFTDVHTPSFPSGHSMMSAVIYLTLGALISRLVIGAGVRAYIIIVALLLTFLVGVTRVYLGVHYPTDVLAGWSAGLAWALICLLVARILQSHGQVEKPGEHTEHPISEKPHE